MVAEIQSKRTKLVTEIMHADNDLLDRLQQAFTASKRSASRMLTAKDAARILGTCVTTVYRYADRGHLQRVRQSARRIRFDRNEVERLATEGITD